MIRYYMDVDSLTEEVIANLRTRGIDVLTSTEVGNLRLDDRDQLAFATAMSRVLYSANTADFRRLHEEWIGAGRSHAGIVVRTRQRLPIEAQVAGLVRIWHGYDSLAGQFHWLS